MRRTFRIRNQCGAVYEISCTSLTYDGGAAIFKNEGGEIIAVVRDHLSIHETVEQPPFATINTRGEKSAWPCQSTDAVAAEGCKATTSEIKP